MKAKKKLTPAKKKKLIAQGNRLGKSQPSLTDPCGSEPVGYPTTFDSYLPTPPPTLYDRRLCLVDEIDYLKSDLEDLSDHLIQKQVQLARARNELNDINRTLRQELQIDATR